MLYVMESFRKVMSAYSPKDTFLVKEFVFAFDLKAERTSLAWNLLQFCEKKGTKTENLEFKGPKGKPYRYQINIYAIMYEHCII